MSTTPATPSEPTASGAATLKPVTNAPEGVPNRSKLETWASAAARAFSAPYTVVETTGALFGMAGAILLAMPALPGWGFGAFLVSNICWLSFSSGHRHWRMFVQQLVFLFSSVLGLWNWWLGPLLLG